MSNRKWLICNPIPNSLASCNKDLNGGYGTWDVIGGNILSIIMGYMKKRSVKIPVMCLAYINEILSRKGIQTFYSEDYDEIIKIVENFEIEACIVYGSLVASNFEQKAIQEIKDKKATLPIIVVGTYPSKFPEKYKAASHIIIGEPEEFFIKWNGRLSELNKSEKLIVSNKLQSLDELPTPSFLGMKANNFAYIPMLKKPTGFIESSRGCPYSCSYYCTYGENQGPLIRSYSAVRLVQMMAELINTYNFKSFQFRDPVFGLKKGFIEEFCNELNKASLNIEWGIETRVEILNIDKIKLMAKAGLRSINIGIETPNEASAKRINRKLSPNDKQRKLITEASREGVKVNAFYMLGLEDETEEDCKETIEYSLGLDTYMARYAVCTPYPGTQYFSEMNKKRLIDEEDLSLYNQKNLVYKHKFLSDSQMKSLIEKAYKEYYFRPKTIYSIIKQSLE